MESQPLENPAETIESLRRRLEAAERLVRLFDAQVQVLERERQKLSAVVGHGDVGFLVVDASLQVVWTNEYFAHHLKKEPAPKWMTDGVPFHERDLEKLPMAPSYIDAYVKPAPAAAEATAKPVEGKATEATKPAEGNGQGHDGKPAEAAVPAGGSSAGRGTGGERTSRRAGEPPAAPAAPKLQKGDGAPDFKVSDDAGTVRQLADYRGKMVLLWFYPKADTPG